MTGSDAPARRFPTETHPVTGGEVESNSGAAADPDRIIDRITDGLSDNGISGQRTEQYGGLDWNEEQTRELIRDTFGHSKRSEPSLPGFGPDGHGENARDDCGDANPMICNSCARSVSIGRTCGQLVCARCGVAWIRDSSIQKTAKTIRIRKEKNRQLTPNCNTHHQIISPPPEWWYDLASAGLCLEDAYELTDQIVADIIDEMRGCGVVVRHSYRGTDDAGDLRDPDQGDMGLWKELINQGRAWWSDVRDELAWQPHYHCILASDFLAGDGFSDVVQNHTGWVIHRIVDEEGKSLASDSAVARAMTYALSHGDIVVNDSANNQSQAFYAGYVQGDEGSRSPWNDLAPSPVDLEFADAAVQDAAETVLGLYSGTTECGKELPAVADANELAYRILQELYGDDAERPARDSPAEEAVLAHVVEGNLSVHASTDSSGILQDLAVDEAWSDLSRPGAATIAPTMSTSSTSSRSPRGSLPIDYGEGDCELDCCRDESSHLFPHGDGPPSEPEECDGTLIPLQEARRRGLLEDDEWLDAAPYGEEARSADAEWDDDLPNWRVRPEASSSIGADNGRSAIG